MSGNFVNCQGNLEIQSNVRELSGNFENLRFKSNFGVNVASLANDLGTEFIGL